MVILELTPEEASLLREMLDTARRDLLHEIHHTDDRAFRRLLQEKTTLVEGLTARLPPLPVAAGG